MYGRIAIRSFTLKRKRKLRHTECTVMVDHSLLYLSKGPNSRTEIIFGVTWMSYEMGGEWVEVGD